MPQVTIVVRELGSTRPDYSLLFTLPDIPCVGDYISVHREDTPTPHGEDLVVRRIWWRLETWEVGTAPPAETGWEADIVRFSVRERDLPKPQKKKPRERKPRPDRQN